jgi:hypothetical protein
MKGKGFVSKWSRPNRGTNTIFSWKDRIKSRNILVSIDGVPGEVRTEHFLNSSLKRVRVRIDIHTYPRDEITEGHQRVT